MVSERRWMAEREGFEPSVEFPLHTLSKRAPSTTRTSLLGSGEPSKCSVLVEPVQAAGAGTPGQRLPLSVGLPPLVPFPGFAHPALFHPSPAVIADALRERGFQTCHLVVSERLRVRLPIDGFQLTLENVVGQRAARGDARSGMRRVHLVAPAASGIGRRFDDLLALVAEAG